MTLSERRVDGVAVVEIAGDFTVPENPGAVKDLVTSLVNRGERRFVLLMRNLARMDSSCLGEIVASYTTVSRNGGTLVIAGAGTHLRRLLEITRLDTIFELYETEAQAVASLQTPRTPRAAAT